MQKRRLAIARLWYEANSFTPQHTGLAVFRAREWFSGDATRKFYAGTATEIGGILEAEAEYPAWDFHYLHCASAPPGGLVEPNVDPKSRLEAVPQSGSQQKMAAGGGAPSGGGQVEPLPSVYQTGDQERGADTDSQSEAESPDEQTSQINPDLLKFKSWEMDDLQRLSPVRASNSAAVYNLLIGNILWRKR